MSTNNSGRFEWFEYMTNDTDKARAFYSELFNWKIEEQKMTRADGSTYTYTMFYANGKLVGGLSKPDHVQLTNTWLAYTTVANLDTAVTYLQQHGGKVLCEEKLPNIGRWVIAQDPQGIVFSPFESANPNCAAPSDDMATGQFCWHELSTNNPEQATAFYSDIFGWQIGEKTACSGGGSYQILQREGKNFGGVFAADANSKPIWRHYVAVESVDETAKRVPQLGGKVLWEPMNIGEQGRIACFQDNQGAEIAVWSMK